MKRITKLTKAQEARFAEWRDRWIEIGLNTTPTSDEDRASFAVAVAKCYRAANMPPPKRVVWVKSPLVLALAAPIAAWKLAVDVAVHDAVRDAVKVIESVWHRYIGGQFWVGGWYWGAPSRVSFFREVCGLTLDGDLDERALAYEDTARTACWWWPHRDFVVACERPTRIRRDDQGRLHSEIGKAVEFGDGWGVSAWHGTPIPHDWITDRQKLDPAVALTHPQVEQRRAAAEIIGWANVLERLHPRVLDRHHDPMVGELLSVDLPDAPDSRFLRVRCGTGRDFCLPVPQEHRTAKAAQVWLWDGLTENEFDQLEVRT